MAADDSVAVERHLPLRFRTDRRAKKARCSCGWEGPWRTAVPTPRRSVARTARATLVKADFEAHLREAKDSTSREAGQ